MSEAATEEEGGSSDLLGFNYVVADGDTLAVEAREEDSAATGGGTATGQTIQPPRVRVSMYSVQPTPVHLSLRTAQQVRLQDLVTLLVVGTAR